MKTTRVSPGVGVAAIVVTILVAIGAQSGFAQGDPLLGPSPMAARSATPSGERSLTGRSTPTRSIM
jgi:hypothetical protein